MLLTIHLPFAWLLCSAAQAPPLTHQFVGKFYFLMLLALQAVSPHAYLDYPELSALTVLHALQTTLVLVTTVAAFVAYCLLAQAERLLLIRHQHRLRLCVSARQLFVDRALPKHMRAYHQRAFLIFAPRLTQHSVFG